MSVTILKSDEIVMLKGKDINIPIMSFGFFQLYGSSRVGKSTQMNRLCDEYEKQSN